MNIIPIMFAIINIQRKQNRKIETSIFQTVLFDTNAPITVPRGPARAVPAAIPAAVPPAATAAVVAYAV